MKVVLQDGIKDCGVCCLLSIIKYYNGDVTKEYLRELTNTTKDGVSFYNLKEAAETIGFSTEALTGKIENINVNNLPCIVHFIINKTYHHFVVLYQINLEKKEVIIMDPAKGKKCLSFSEFNLLTSNNYLFLTPTKKLPIIKKKNIIYKGIITITKSSKNVILIICLLTIVLFFLNILTSFNFKYLLEFAINYNISENVIKLSTLLIFLCFLKNLNIYLKNILLLKWTSQVDFYLTTTTYNRLLLLPYLYYKNRTSGEVLSRIKDLNIIKNFLSNFFTIISTDLASLLIFLYLLYKYNHCLFIVILPVTIIIIIITNLNSIKKRKLIKQIKKREEVINSYIIEGVSNVDTVKGNHLEKRISDKFILKYKSFLDFVYKYSLTNTIYMFFKSNLIDILNLLVLLIGSYLIIKNKFTLSNLIVYQLFLSYYLESFYNLLALLEEYHSYKIALERVEELFLINEEIFKNNYFYLSYNLAGNIEITNLSYKVGTRYLFKNLNLKIKKGEKILLCGPSGCGKSTLVKLLLRYFEVPFGTIKITGIDINHHHLENLRTNITYTTSNEYLFTDTLLNNILLSKNSETDINKVEEVSRICLIEEIIKAHPSKYQRMVEENGFNFSNGERQRIILARALLRKSTIYIFDEALSQIDIRRERKILENMFSYLEDKTVIVISHRFNNKNLFDRILKIEKGVIIENPKL